MAMGVYGGGPMGSSSGRELEIYAAGNATLATF